MGLQDASTRLGLALGSPVVGFAIDHSSPAWGFARRAWVAWCIAAAGLLRPPRAGTGRSQPALAAAARAKAS